MAGYNLGFLEYSITADTKILEAEINAAKAAMDDLRKQMAMVDDAMRANAISADTYAKAVKRLNADMAHVQHAGDMAKQGMISTTNAISGATSKLAGTGQALLQSGRAVQDFFQGGIGGVLNNIEGVTMALGGPAGLAGALTVVGVAASILGPHLIEMLKSMMGDAPEILSGRLDRLKEKIANLEKKDTKVALDILQLEEAKEEVEHIERALSAVARLRTQQNTPQKAAAHAVESAFNEVPGGSARAHEKLNKVFIEEALINDKAATMARQRAAELDAEIKEIQRIRASGGAGPGVQEFKDLLAERQEQQDIIKARRAELSKKGSDADVAAGSMFTEAYDEAAKGPQYSEGDKRGKNKTEILGRAQQRLVDRVRKSLGDKMAEEIERDLLNAAGGVGPQREIEAQGAANTSKGKLARRTELAEQASKRLRDASLGRYELETTKGHEMGAAHKKNALDDVMKDIAAGSTSEAAMAKASTALAAKLNKIMDPAYVPEVVMDLMDDMAVDLEKRLSKANPDELLSLKEAAQKSIDESPEAKQAAALKRKAEAATAKQDRDIKRATHKQARPLVSMYDSAFIPALQASMFQGAKKEDLEKQVEARLRKAQPGKAKEAYVEAAMELVDRAWAGLTENMARAAMGVGSHAAATHGALTGGALPSVGGVGGGYGGAIGVSAGFGFPGIMPGAGGGMFGVGFMEQSQARARQTRRDRVARQQRAFRARTAFVKRDPFAGTSLEGFDPNGRSIGDQWAAQAALEQRRATADPAIQAAKDRDTTTDRRAAIQPMINAGHASGLEGMQARRDAIQPMIDASTNKDKDRFDAAKKAIRKMPGLTNNKTQGDAMLSAMMLGGNGTPMFGGAAEAQGRGDEKSPVEESNKLLNRTVELLTQIKDKPVVGVLT